MNINYIILAHKQPKQLKRLIERLSDHACFFYIHIDLNSDIEPFVNEVSMLNNVQFISNEKREFGTWGDIGIVRATINILEEIVNNNGPGYCVLMSGQDYPIKDNAHIKSFFSENYGTEFISHFSIPSIDWNAGGMERICNYKFNISNKRGDLVLTPSIFQSKFYTLKSLKNIYRLAKGKKFTSILKLLKRRAKFPNYLKPFGGDQWWAITTETAKKVLQFINEHPDYLVFHKETLLPDEIFFQSIIVQLNSATPHLIKPSLTYVNWQKMNVPLPVTFNIEDISELRNQSKEKLFARKFDISMDENILNAIDQSILYPHTAINK